MKCLKSTKTDTRSIRTRTEKMIRILLRADEVIHLHFNPFDIQGFEIHVPTTHFMCNWNIADYRGI